jgi:hypothetical protein
MADNDKKSGGRVFRSGFFGFLGVAAAIIVVVVILGAIGQSNVSDTAKDDNQPADSAPSCGPASVTISKLNAYREYDYAHLTGVIRHNCDHAIGIHLKWTAYNSDGTVAFSDDFWPASTTNIPPNTDYPFETMNEAPRGKWHYEVQAIDVNTW